MTRNDQILLGVFCATTVSVGLCAVANFQQMGSVAEWASAIGVVAAILSSARLAQWQYAKAREDDLKRSLDAENLRVANIMRFVFHVEMFLLKVQAWALKGKRGELKEDDATPEQAVVLAELLKIEVLSLPDFTLIQLLSELRGEVHRIADLMNRKYPMPNQKVYQQADRDAAATIAARARSRCKTIREAGSEFFLAGGASPDY